MTKKEIWDFETGNHECLGRGGFVGDGDGVITETMFFIFGGLLALFRSLCYISYQNQGG